MISTDAHSQTATHLLNLPKILRPGYTSQIDQPESVDAVEYTDPQVHQNDQFSDQVEMEYTDVGPTEDRSDLGVSRSDGNKGTMRDVIDIFKPVCSNKGEVSEVKGGEEGDVKDEEEGDAPNDSGWFPFGGLLVSNHKSGEAGTFRSAGVRSADEGFDFTPAAQPLISVLMASYLHNILSRAQYLKFCTLMELCGTKLRKWTAIWWIRKSLRAILNMEPIQRERQKKLKFFKMEAHGFGKPICLPPRVSNQQYNCHFLSTSNTSGPLELANQIVDELNDITKDGYFAYDCELQQEVLVSTVVLCFLGDLPMHAEVTNTPLPGAALNPCRICHLGVQKRSDKSGEDYIYHFLGMDSLGNRDVVDYRKWSETIQRSHKLWEAALKYSKNACIEESKSLGVQDVLKKAFKSELAKIMALDKHQNHKLFNRFLQLLGFDGCQDTPVEVLHVILLGVIKYIAIDFLSNTIKPRHLNDLLGASQSFITDALDLPKINAAYLYKHHKSMVGKDFKIVLQCATFVFFQFMDEQQKELWCELCRMAPYVFQTHITDMQVYLKEMEILIDNLLLQLMKCNARWVNKPKFHMLIHLVHSIARFGPASLFATEKYESFNSILRNASVHSNRQHPGKDLAVLFSNFQCLRAILSGALLWNHVKQCYFRASKELRRIFKMEDIQQSIGYVHSSIYGSGDELPGISLAKSPKADRVTVPREVSDKYPNHQFTQECCLKMTNKESVRKGYFAYVLQPGNRPAVIGKIHSIWRASSRSSIVGPKSHIICLQVNEFERSTVSDYYQMRILKRTNKNHVCSPELNPALTSSNFSVAPTSGITQASEHHERMDEDSARASCDEATAIQSLFTWTGLM
ncbi:hypothetical protein PTTG_27650 [Puccinia triticina 1-1 BBBD Race 1]|uniref:Uncharacterized protein n=1 Tax=Puccinia triticina (isolate 1-1 / race 1 (BBBD)) TaxID=630390 RepID=A0A180GKF2_PUCT1|nr:hypothetical protein PTTG_27650 [Puccinia triticina 1-1 BBBD Race 1]